MITITKPKSRSELRKLKLANAAAALALTNSNIQCVIDVIEDIFSSGQYSIAQLEALKPLVTGFTFRYLEDVVGCARGYPDELCYTLGGFLSYLRDLITKSSLLA